MDCLKCKGKIVKDGWFNNRYVCKECGKKYYYRFEWPMLVAIWILESFINYFAESAFRSFLPESPIVVYHIISLAIALVIIFLVTRDANLSLKLHLIKLYEDEVDQCPTTHKPIDVEKEKQ